MYSNSSPLKRFKISFSFNPNVSHNESTNSSKTTRLPFSDLTNA